MIASFDIRNFVDRLKRAKGKDRWYCPVCGGDNLTFNPENYQGYTCWNDQSDQHRAEIKEAVSPWAEVAQQRKNATSTFTRKLQKQPQKRASTPVLPKQIKLARLPEPAKDSPQPQERNDRKRGKVLVTTYRYSDSQWVERIQWDNPEKPKGYSKEFFPWHIGKDDQPVCKKGEADWLPYRWEEAIAAAKASRANAVIVCEGEGCVEGYRSIGYAAITFQGSKWSEVDLREAARLLEAHGLMPIFHPDNDTTGEEKAGRLSRACNQSGVPCLLLNPLNLCRDLPESGDVVDCLKAMGASEYIGRLEAEIMSATTEPTTLDFSDQAQQKRNGFPVVRGLDKNGNPLPPKLPKASAGAKWVAEEYRDRLAYHIASESFYRYGSEFEGIWTAEPEILIQQVLQTEIDATGIEYGAEYVSSILKLLKALLAVKRWDEQPGLLPLQNGVLEVASGKLLPHAPGYRLTWQLPYDYDPAAICGPIQDWLLEAQDGDPQRVQLLRAYLKAIVTGRTDLQRFIELIGPGGTGKGTYTRLAIALVGLQNTFITELKHLEANRFEVAGIYGKRLVLIADSERYAGNVTVLKSLTGQDPLRYEQKYKQAQNGFIPNALVIVAANEAIASADYTSGLERRRLTVPFLKIVAPGDRRDLLTVNNFGVTGEFVPYLPGLLNWVLALPDDEMMQLVRNTAESVPSLAQWKADSLLATNPIAEWLDACCIFAPGTRTQVGDAVKIRKTEGDVGSSTAWDEYKNQDSWLYPSYRAFCDRVGSRAVSIRRFSDLVLDLCQNQLKHPEIQKGRDRDGAYFLGIALRSEESDAPNSISGEKVINFDTNAPEADSSDCSTSDSQQNKQTIDEMWSNLTPEQRGQVDQLLQQIESDGEKPDDGFAADLRRYEHTYPHPVRRVAWEQMKLSDRSKDLRRRIKQLLSGPNQLGLLVGQQEETSGQR